MNMYLKYMAVILLLFLGLQDIMSQISISKDEKYGIHVGNDTDVPLSIESINKMGKMGGRILNGQSIKNVHRRSDELFCIKGGI